MTISESIRALAREGVATAEIARRLGIRYQHAYNVLKAEGASVKSPAALAPASTAALNSSLSPKSALKVEDLLEAGFQICGQWILTDSGDLRPDRKLPTAVGVYAFARLGVVQYVGVATMGLAKRLYFYGKTGVTQRTSLRLNAIIKGELLTVPSIDIYFAVPPDLDWNGLPIHGSAGLELGLIKKFALPWNMRSAG